MYELHTTWMILIYSLLSERIQNQKATFCDFIFMIVLKRQNYKEIKQVVVCKGLGPGGGVDYRGSEGSSSE